MEELMIIQSGFDGKPRYGFTPTILADIYLALKLDNMLKCKLENLFLLFFHHEQRKFRDYSSR